MLLIFLDNNMYICVGIRAVFLGNEGEKEGAHFIMPNPFTFMNFDMDNNGFMWLVGNNTHLVRTYLSQAEQYK